MCERSPRRRRFDAAISSGPSKAIEGGRSPCRGCLTAIVGDRAGRAAATIASRAGLCPSSSSPLATERARGMRGKGGGNARSLDRAAGRNRLGERSRAGSASGSSARGGCRRPRARSSRRELARRTRRRIVARSQAATIASCCSSPVVTGEESELGRSGGSGRNLQRRARATKAIAAPPSDRRTTRVLRATPPPPRRR